VDLSFNEALRHSQVVGYVCDGEEPVVDHDLTLRDRDHGGR
jgi:hypothetical protein